MYLTLCKQYSIYMAVISLELGFPDKDAAYFFYVRFRMDPSSGQIIVISIIFRTILQ